MENQEIENTKIDQILKLVEKNGRKKWTETLSTILLSAATVLSAWCVFQSSQWSGEQYFRIDDETAANQFRLQYEVSGTQRKAAELQLFLEYSSAITDSNFRLADFLYDRFPRTFKEPFDEWIKLEPYKDPDAPSSPFTMKGYTIPELDKAKKYEEKALAFKKAANEADNHADNYVLLSLILSTVLFFCGMSGLADAGKNQRILIGIASFIFVVALVFIIFMPVVF